MERMETRCQRAELSRGKDGKWGVGTFMAKVLIRPRTFPLVHLFCSENKSQCHTGQYANKANQRFTCYEVHSLFTQ